jgi:crotonobetainyl-CoA:carnitine CoA-transferase CaiB-like acyl-CoA transferase
VSTSKQALAGIKVVEFAMFAAGPMVGKHLGEHGAQVIHVESRSRPDGFRMHYPPYKDNKPGLNRTGSFAIFNDSKYSLALNLKSPRAVQLALQLIAWADVVIENFVPGVIRRLGLDYEAARKVNPSVIYLSSCNMGQTGPKAGQRGFGSQLTSQSGFTFLAGYPNEPEPMLLYGPYIDFVAVGFGLTAVMAALDHRQQTGCGQYIDLSQYETGLQFIAPALLDYEVNGHVMSQNGNRNANAAPHGAFPCRGDDRWCVIAAYNEDEWKTLCRAVGHPEWMTDARFASLQARKQNEDELDRLLGEWTIQYTPREVMERLQAAGVAAAAVNTLGDIFSDPQLNHRQIWRDLPHAELGQFQYEAPPFALSETPAEEYPSPLLGEHNHVVCSEILGLAETEIDELVKQGVLE